MTRDAMWINWEADEVEGPEGSAPKTVAPLEFVVFKIDEAVLQISYRYIYVTYYR